MWKKTKPTVNIFIYYISYFLYIIYEYTITICYYINKIIDNKNKIRYIIKFTVYSIF